MKIKPLDARTAAYHQKQLELLCGTKVIVKPFKLSASAIADIKIQLDQIESIDVITRFDIHKSRTSRY